MRRSTHQTIVIRKATALGGTRAIIETEGTKFDSSAFGRIPLIPTRTWLPVFEAGSVWVERDGKSLRVQSAI